ncbi:UBX domain-containing protein 6 [Oopsacas minuta]|uniref:UBX domain-containing protein 6 n=1 Tax=Oopsacas minuta TaxID=111878 RepID=A0AAV7JLD3_9METZ|nr:UBX domain-containing protein 6 [Oopsacas minuta]
MSELTHRIKSMDKATKPEPQAGERIPTNPVVSNCSVCMKILISLLVVIVSIIIAIPSPISPVSYTLSAANPNLSDDVTNILKVSEKIHLPGCESVVIDSNGYIYTGTYNGLVVQISPDFSEVRPLIRTGSAPVDDDKCNNSSLADNVTDCGKVMGVRMLNEDTLIVVDSMYGIFSISIKLKSKTLLFDLKNQPEYLDIPIILPNSVVILPDDNSLLFTDSFTKFTQKRGILALIEHGTDGRVYKYDFNTRKVTLFLSNLHFPNGIELHRDGESILIAEFSICRIIRYYYRGNKKGTTEIFSDNFIGVPDNIQRARGSGYWVGVPLERDNVYDVMLKYPIIGSLITKLFDAEFLEKQTTTNFGKGIAVKLSEEGEMLEFVYDPEGEHAYFVTEAVDRKTIEYGQRLSHLQNALQDMYLQEPLYASCLMIHTLGTNSPLTTHLVGTSVGLIEKDKLTACIETINKCLKNILEHPDEDKYRSIRCESKVLKDKVLPVTGSELFLSSVGFVQELNDYQGNEVLFYVLAKPKNVDEVATQMEHLTTAFDMLNNVTPVKLELNRDIHVYKATSSVNRFPELPSSFFILKPEEVMKENQLRREQVEINEMLLTRAQRERLEQQTTRQYQFCVVRVRLPEGIVLQATFRAKEKLSDLFYFLSQSLRNEAMQFSLFHQGGKKLENMNLSLQEAELVPAALVNLRIDLGSQTDAILKPSLMRNIERMS